MGDLLAALRPEFTQRAACHGEPITLFFPEHGGPMTKFDDEYRKSLCGSCPVFAECDEWADANNELGFWAGRMRVPAARATHFPLTGLGEPNREQGTSAITKFVPTLKDMPSHLFPAGYVYEGMTKQELMEWRDA